MMNENSSDYENPFSSFYLSEQFVKETESIISKGLMSPEIFKIPEIRALATEPFNHFIVGVPGSGKTMALAFLTVESLAFIHSHREDFQDYKSALNMVSPGLWGIYFGLILNEKLLVPHDFQGFGLKKDMWTAFFGDFVNYNLLKRMISHLRLSLERPNHHIPKWLKINDKSAAICKSVEGFSKELQLPESCYTTSGLDEWCKQRLLAYQKMIKERTSLNIDPIEYPALPIIKDVGYLPIKLIEHLRENHVITDEQRIYFIIDEYDQCELSGKIEFARLINTFVKVAARSNIKNVSVKIGTRPHGFYEKRILEGETKIEKDRDYHEINLGNFRKVKNSKTFTNLLTDIANRRMRNCSWFSDRGIIDFLGIIEDIEPEAEAGLYIGGKSDKDAHFRTIRNFMTDDATFNKLVSNIQSLTADVLHQKYLVIETCRHLNKTNIKNQLFFDDKIIANVILNVEILGKFLNRDEELKTSSKIRYKLKDMREPALFQLANDYKQQKYYYGFDTIRLMSDGILLSFIKICSAIFKEIGTKTTIFQKLKKVDIRWQNRAIRDVSMATRYDFSRFLTYGQNIQLFIDELGFVFRAVQLIPTAPYPTPNGFSVDKELGWILEDNLYTVTTETSNLFEDATKERTFELNHLKKMLKEAIDWGYLFEMPHRSKSGSYKNRTKYYLNSLLVPYFDLSPKHLKEPIYVQIDDILALASTDSNIRTQKRKDLLNNIKQATAVVG